MKKAFIQKLSIAMASALVITAATPATADAAAKMKLNKTSKTLYVNKDNKSGTSNKYDFNILNKGTGKYSYSWSTGDKKVATVNSKGVVTAKGVGTTKVTCKVTYKTGAKKGKTYKKLTANVTVKANAAKVVINNAPENNQISVGTTFDFNRTMTAANGGKATDKTEWFLFADEALTKESDVATIDKNGVVTANKAGEFYVVAKTYQSAKYKEAGYTAVSEAVKVTVPLQMTGASVVSVDTMKLTFDSSVKELIKKNDDIEIETVATNKIKFPVKSYTISEDGKEVTVVSYQDFSNDATYKVTAAGTSKETKAQIGEIASIVIDNQNFEPQTDKKAGDLKYKVFDANGVDVTKKYGFDKLSVISSKNNGSEVNDKGEVFLRTKGDQVQVQLKFFKYNTTTGADESIVSNTAILTAADATATQTVKWAIGDATKEKEAYEKNVKTIAAGAEGKQLFVTLKDSYGKEVKADAFESLNDKILVVDNAGNLYPLAAGTATVKVSKGGYYDYLTIVVSPKAEIANLVADNNSFVLSNAYEDGEEKIVKFTLKGTYGDTFKKNGNADVEVTSVTDVVTVLDANDNACVFTNNKASVEVKDGEFKLKFKATKGKEGSAQFRVSFGGKITVVSVSVKKPNGAVSYRIDMDKTEIDNFKETDKATVNVFNIDGAGTTVSKVTNSKVTYAVKNEKGETKLEGNLETGSFVIDAYTKKLAAGKYTVEVTAGPLKVVKEFTVKSSKLSSDATINKTEVKADGKVDINLILETATTFKVDGKDVTGSSIVYTFINITDKELITGATVASDGTLTNGTINWGTKSELKLKLKKVEWKDAAGTDYSKDLDAVVTIKK